jgi:hypothetical protein
MFSKTKVAEREQFLESAKAARIEREKDRKWNQSSTIIQVFIYIN